MYCQICSTLLNDVCVASNSYCEAISHLTNMAGKAPPETFALALQDCKACHSECDRAKDEYLLHQSTHA